MTRSNDRKTDGKINRRALIQNAGLIGCSMAASPLLTPVTFAQAPGDNRLVVIVLRGAMDGLDVVQPYGDPSLAKWRRTLSQGPDGGTALDLDGFYALHQGLAGLMPLWHAGELGFAHAVSTPYRDKRSHFDGQDFLENGGASPDGTLTGAEDGWLNRLLGHLGQTSAQTGLSVGREQMLLMRGENKVASWSPEADLRMSEQAKLLLDLIYQKDPLFLEAAKTAQELSKGGERRMDIREAGSAKALAGFTAERLLLETRIAGFSLAGWDTHRVQKRGLPRALDDLQTAILTLKAQLGPVWKKTAVIALTEFGRTVRENGSQGTDHGTGGVMVYAGGAVKGGQVHGRWPGLGEADLYNRRDLMPTDDVRRYAGWVMADLFGLDRAAMDHVFPQVDFGQTPGLIL